MNNNAMDSEIKDILNELCEEEVTEWKKIDCSEEYAVPKKSYHRMRRRVRMAEFHQRYGKVIRVGARVAIYLLVILGIASALTVAAVAIHKQKIFLKRAEDGKSTGMTVEPEDTSTVLLEEENLAGEIGYIPEGYELVEEESSSFIHTKRYENMSSEYIIISVYNSLVEMNYDIERHKMRECCINGYEGYSITGEERNIIIWNVDNTTYEVMSDALSEKELIKISEKIK